MRLIDADVLEREGWRMSRTVQIDKNTMELQTRKPTEFPTIEPERKIGKWSIKNGELAFWDVCSECGKMVLHKAPFYSFCPNCGAKMNER